MMWSACGQRARLALVMVAAVSLGAVGCGGDDDEPRAGEIRSTIEDLWREAGVDLDDTTWTDYTWQSTPHEVGCADTRDEDDRWIAFRKSNLAGELYSQDGIWDGVNAHLEDGGFGIQRYRQPGSGGLTVRAERDELVVFVDVSRNGSTHIDVIAGPCASFMGQEPPTASEPIP